MIEYNCIIHWKDGTEAKSILQQSHIDNLNSIPMVDHVERGKQVWLN